MYDIINLGDENMKYYILKEKEKDGYLSRTLCRINDEGIFEEYSCYTDSSSGKWIENKKKNLQNVSSF